MKKTLRVFALLSLLVPMAVVMPSAKATPLLNGGTAVPTFDNITNLGTLLASITGTLSPISQTFSGTEHQEVWQLADNTLVFAYQDNVGPGVLISDPIIRNTMTAFNGYATSVAYRTVAFGAFSASSIAPVSADRSVAGDTVGFNFDTSGVPNGSSSAVLLVYTNATQYASTGFMNAIDGGVSSSQSFAPTGAAVPEPATFGMAGAVLVALGLLRKRGGGRV